MSALEDDDMQHRAEQEPIDGLLIDDLLTLDRRLTLRAANERIAGGMYARIARAHGERSLVRAGRWRWALAGAAAAWLALAAIWFAQPAKHGKEVKAGNPQGPETISAAPVPGRVDVRPTVTRLPGKKLAHSTPRAHPEQKIAPHLATFPLNVAPTEQEVLLMRLASRQPKELLAVAKAIADMNDRDDRQRHDFEQWVQKGEKQ